MTTDEALEFYARKIDEVRDERVERNFAAMIEDNLTDDFIKEFQRLEAETYPAIRAETLAKLREWLEHDGKTLQ
jgi:hypothetical protein